MGIALVNLTHKPVGRVPPRHFIVVSGVDAKGQDARLVRVEFPDHRRIGAQALRGRYAWLEAMAVAAAAGDPVVPPADSVVPPADPVVPPADPVVPPAEDGADE